MFRTRFGGYQRRGFSLLEALFSIALLAAAISTFLTLLPIALQNNDHDSYYLQAVAAGQEYLDALRSAVENNQTQPSPPQILIDPVGSGKQSPGYFNIAGACNLVAPLSALYHCSVSVQWIERQQTRAYNVESYATRQVS
jgi:type II secretory pathway pseudopilin PulG